ncbi:MAG: hemolysin [Solirubrobacteraceae bacterium]|nr:hemolysin [Solirubrobacteraceae bacterium]
MAGEVLVGPERRRIDKPGQMVASDVEVAVDEAPAYVSRGGTKLANALDALGVEVAGRQALDVGASTGGFTDVLLQRGAAHVVALDVAYGELHWKLRTDDRVTVLERTNARAIEPEILPFAPDLVVVDVSFISLTKVLPAVLACAAAGFDCLAMVKPQFEVGRERVGKGVVHDPALRREAIDTVAAGARALGHEIRGEAESGLPGPKGNLETFLWIADGAPA